MLEVPIAVHPEFDVSKQREKSEIVKGWERKPQPLFPCVVTRTLKSSTIKDSNVEQEDLKTQNRLTEAMVVSVLGIPCLEKTMQLTESTWRLCLF